MDRGEMMGVSSFKSNQVMIHSPLTDEFALQVIVPGDLLNLFDSISRS